MVEFKQAEKWKNFDMLEGAKWIKTQTFAILAIVLIAGYASLGAFVPEYRSVIDGFVSPLVDGLSYLYLNIRVCSLVGDMDALYYRNVTGICVILSVLYNFFSIIYMLKNRRFTVSSCELALTRFMYLTKLKCRPIAWKKLSNAIYVNKGFLAILCSFDLLNTMFGWIQFPASVWSLPFTLLICFFFIMPSCLCAGYWSIVLQCINCDWKYSKKPSDDKEGSND